MRFAYHSLKLNSLTFLAPRHARTPLHGSVPGSASTNSGEDAPNKIGDLSLDLLKRGLGFMLNSKTLHPNFSILSQSANLACKHLEIELCRGRMIWGHSLNSSKGVYVGNSTGDYCKGYGGGY